MKKEKKFVIGIIGIAFAAFCVLAVFVVNQKMQFFNDAVYQYISAGAKDWITALTRTISNFGAWFSYVTLLVILLLIPQTRRQIAVPAAIVVVISAMLNHVIKVALHIDRPTVEWLVEESGYGFPSGHVMNATSFIGILVYLFCTRKKDVQHKYIGYILYGIFVLMMAYSRVYLGVHSAADVIGGYLCGTIVLLISILVISKIREKKAMSPA